MSLKLFIGWVKIKQHVRKAWRSKWWQDFTRHPLTPYLAVIIAALSAGLIAVHLSNIQQGGVIAKQAQTIKELGVLSVSQAVTIKRLNGVSARLTADEKLACQIQAKGLPADHELAGAFGGLHAFFADLVFLAARSPKKKTTSEQRRETRYLLGVINHLDTHLANYAALTAQQPATRSCSF